MIISRHYELWTRKVTRFWDYQWKVLILISIQMLMG